MDVKYKKAGWAALLQPRALAFGLLTDPRMFPKTTQVIIISAFNLI